MYPGSFCAHFALRAGFGTGALFARAAKNASIASGTIRQRGFEPSPKLTATSAPERIQWWTLPTLTPSCRASIGGVTARASPLPAGVDLDLIAVAMDTVQSLMRPRAAFA